MYSPLYTEVYCSIVDTSVDLALLKYDRAIALRERDHAAWNRALRFVTRAIMPHRRK